MIEYEDIVASRVIRWKHDSDKDYADKIQRERDLYNSNVNKWSKIVLDTFGDIYTNIHLSANHEGNAVWVTCPDHGDIWILKKDILKGVGCAACKKKNELLDKFKIAHGDRYNYSKMHYINCRTPITVICETHGDYEVLPASHAKGTECPECKVRSSGGRWDKDSFTDVAGDKICTLYLIECYSGEERFYKAGITSKSIEERFNQNVMPYRYRIISRILGDAEYIWDLEQKVHKENKDIRYIPNIKFGGYTECYSETPSKNLWYNDCDRLFTHGD